MGHGQRAGQAPDQANEGGQAGAGSTGDMSDPRHARRRSGTQRVTRHRQSPTWQDPPHNTAGIRNSILTGTQRARRLPSMPVASSRRCLLSTTQAASTCTRPRQLQGPSGRSSRPRSRCQAALAAGNRRNAMVPVDRPGMDLDDPDQRLGRHPTTLSPCDSTGSPFAYVARTRCTRSTRVKNPRLALSTTWRHARAADITPGGSEPTGVGDVAGGEDGPVEPVITAVLGPLATLPHPAVAKAMTMSRPPIRHAWFPAMATTAMR